MSILSDCFFILYYTIDDDSFEIFKSFFFFLNGGIAKLGLLLTFAWSGPLPLAEASELLEDIQRVRRMQF